MFKGKKMAGQMGNTRITTQNLEVVSSDEESGVILVKGAVPGAADGWILISDAVKVPRPDDVPYPAALRGGAAAAPEQADETPAEGAADEAKPEGGAAADQGNEQAEGQKE